MAGMTPRELDRRFENRNQPGWDAEDLSDQAYSEGRQLWTLMRNTADSVVKICGADEAETEKAIDSLQQVGLHGSAAIIERERRGPAPAEG